jgi:hypothetical protein
MCRITFDVPVRDEQIFFPEIDIFSEAAAGRFNVVNVQRMTDVAAGDGSK